MKIFVAGSTGRVGEKLLTELTETGHEVLAGARQPEKVKNPKVSPIKFDLTMTIDEMATIIAGVGVVMDVAGSSGGSLLQIDLFGATNLMQAAEKAGVKRFILLSTVFALQPGKWTTPGFIALRDYYIAKHFADLYLVKNTKLDYTILQPGYLTEAAGTGKIAINDDISAPATIADVAASLAAMIDIPETIHKVITMHNGDRPIKEALKNS